MAMDCDYDCLFPVTETVRKTGNMALYSFLKGQVRVS